jgi:hypothetical protein
MSDTRVGCFDNLHSDPPDTLGRLDTLRRD